MINRNIVNGLASAGAMLVLVAVLSAAGTALAAEPSSKRVAGDAFRTAADYSLDKAALANREAAKSAVSKISNQNRKDLDFRLLAPTSVLVGRGR